jgi:hypothetical protein
MSMTQPLRILFAEDVPYDMELTVRSLRGAGVQFESMRVEGAGVGATVID